MKYHQEMSLINQIIRHISLVVFYSATIFLSLQEVHQTSATPARLDMRSQFLTSKKAEVKFNFFQLLLLVQQVPLEKIVSDTFRKLYLIKAHKKTNFFGTFSRITQELQNGLAPKFTLHLLTSNQPLV